MTDKEWLELCEWAEKNYPENIITDKCYVIDMLLSNHNMLEFNKSGRIDIYKNIGDLSIRFNLDCNRTAKQIKSIIENLL
jgi:hypothetical protein